MALIDILPGGFSYQTSTGKIATTLGDSTAIVDSEPTLKRANKNWFGHGRPVSREAPLWSLNISLSQPVLLLNNFAMLFSTPWWLKAKLLIGGEIEPAYAPEGKVTGGEVLRRPKLRPNRRRSLGAVLPPAPTPGFYWPQSP